MKDGTSTGNISFKQHRDVRHNMWNYLYFAMHLWQQPREKDSSVEMIVRQCMENGDVSWFPIGYYEANTYDDVDCNNYNCDYGDENESGNEYKNRENVRGRDEKLSRTSNSNSKDHSHSYGRQLSSGSNLANSFEGSGHMKNSNIATSSTIGGSKSSDSYDKDFINSDRLLRIELERMTELMTEKINELQSSIQILTKQQNQRPLQSIPTQVGDINTRTNSPTIVKKLASLPPLEIPSNF